MSTILRRFDPKSRFAAFVAAGLPFLAAAPFVPARPALAAQEAKPAEPASASRLVGVALPEGAFRLTDAGALGELTTQLRTVANEGGFALGQAEAILWGGEGHNDARNGAIKSSLVQTLKKAGYDYQVAAEKDTKDGRLTFFAAGKTAAKEATLGFWVAGESHLVLAWGAITPKETGKQAASQAPKGEAAGADKKAGPPAASGDKVPSDLVGSWSWTTISGVNYRDTTTNRLMEPSGMSARFTFTKDGRYKKFFYVRQRTYGLVTEATTTEQGAVSFGDDGTFTLRPEKGHYKGSTGSRIIDRDMTQAERKPATYRWEWRSEGGKRQLYMGPGEKSLSLFKPGE